MIDPKIAEAAFSLKKDELSKPVEGQFASRAGARQRDRAGQAADLRGGQGRDQGSPGRGARQPGDAGAAREGRRTSARPARRSRRSAPPEASLPRDRRRSTATARAATASRRSSMPRPPRSRRRHSPAPSASRPTPPSSPTAAMPGSMCSPSRRRSRSPSRRCKAEVKAGAVEQERRKEIAATAAKLVERLSRWRDHRGARQRDRRQAGEDRPVTRNTSPQGLPAQRRAAGLRVAQGRCHLGADGGRQGAHRPARRRRHSGAPRRPRSRSIS